MSKSDTQFKKGKSGNPKGRPNVPRGSLDIRKLAAEELIEIISTMFSATAKDVERILNDPSESNLNQMVASIMQKSVESGCASRFETLLNRVIGKVKEQVVHEITRPSILVRKDGSEVVFTNKAEEKE